MMQWFKHDTDCTQDAKIKKLLIKHGAIGYAIYFHCLELIAAETSESNLTFELEHDSEIIADNLHIKGTAEKSGIAIVEEIMRFIIDLDLFQESNGRIFCFKLLKRLDSSMTSNTKFRELIVKSKEHHDRIMIPSCKPNQQEEPNQQEQQEKPLDGLTRIELAKAIWNEMMPRKPYRYTAVNMGEQVRSECLRPMAVYSDDEIAEAIRNYARILASPEHEVKSPYESFHGFMRSGVEKFDSGADPWEAYKKRSKGFETAGEREDRMRKEALDRLKQGILDERPDAMTPEEQEKLKEEIAAKGELPDIDFREALKGTPLGRALR